MPTKNLPVWQIVKEVYRFVWATRRDLVAIATMPVFVLTILIAILVNIFGVAALLDEDSI